MAVNKEYLCHYYYYCLIFVFVIFGSCSSAQPQFPLLASDIEAAQFIIKQYGFSGLNIDLTSLCNFTEYIGCSQSAGSFTFIARINITVDVFVNMGMPNASIETLGFYRIDSLFVSAAGRVADPSINILTRMAYMSVYRSIRIHNDPSITEIPEVFTANTKAMVFGIDNCPVTVIQGSFFAGSRLSSISIKNTLLYDYSFDSASPSLWLPYLLDLDIDINTGGLAFAVNVEITNTVFPALISLSINNTGSGQINVDHTTQKLNHNVTLSNRLGGTLVFNTTIPANIFSIQIQGIVSMIQGYDQYTGLKYLVYRASPISNYPFFSYPPLLETLYFDQCDFTRVPTLVPNYNLLALHFVNNKIQTIDWTTFQNATNLYIDLRGNNLISGTVPEFMCRNLINIRGTSISSVPDCFWCHMNGPSAYPLATDLTPPSPLTCNVVIDTPSPIILISGSGLIQGQLIGWGNYYNSCFVSPGIPNQELKLYYPRLISSPTYTLNISFSLNIYRQLTFIETGIFLAGRSIVKNLYGALLLFKFKMLFVNTYLQHNVLINSVPCTTVELLVVDKTFMCSLNYSIPSGPTTLTISNQYNTVASVFRYNSSYPYISSAGFEKNETKVLSIYGEFGPYLSLASVLLNETIDCAIFGINSTFINCALSSVPNPGLANLTITVDFMEYHSPNVLYFPTTSKNSSSTPDQQCPNNCFNRGKCANGICICDDPLYNPDDNCLTKYTNTTPIIDPTKPTTSFDIDGVDFQFEMVSIQELDVDDTIINELITNNWNSTINSNDNNNNTDISSFYQLNTTNNEQFRTSNITASISFSSKSRVVEFGTQSLNIPPSSIKLTVSINNWNYSSSLSTLRIVFRTILNNQQFATLDCGETQEIDSLQFDSLSSSLQYLRVVKDNVQFNGRFIDYVLSDGRESFSQTTVINQTSISTNTTSTLIGVSMPQCRSCLLDPDFTPLIIDKSTNLCNSENGTSDRWRIIVGSVVGGIALVALAVGATLMILKKKKMSRESLVLDEQVDDDAESEDPWDHYDEADQMYSVKYNELMTRPIHVIAQHGSIELVKQSLSLYASYHKYLVDQMSYFNHSKRFDCRQDKKIAPQTPLDAAAYYNHFDLLVYLDGRLVVDQEDSNWVQTVCTTDAIRFAARNNNIKMVKWLLENRNEGFDETALKEAAANNHLEMIKLLFDAQPHVLLSDIDNTEPISMALRGGHLELVQWFLDTVPYKMTPYIFMEAVESGSIEMVRLVLYRNQSVSQMGQNLIGRLIELAISNGSVEIGRLLLGYYNIAVDVEVYQREIDMHEIKTSLVNGDLDKFKELVVKMQAFDWDSSLLRFLGDSGNVALLSYAHQHSQLTLDCSYAPHKKLLVHRIVQNHYQQQQQDIKSSRGYIDCLEYLISNSFITINNAVEALRYWNGDPYILERIPLIHDHLAKNMLKVDWLVTQKLESIGYNNGSVELMQYHLKHYKNINHSIGHHHIIYNNLEVIQFMNQTNTKLLPDISYRNLLRICQNTKTLKYIFTNNIINHHCNNQSQFTQSDLFVTKNQKIIKIQNWLNNCNNNNNNNNNQTDEDITINDSICNSFNHAMIANNFNSVSYLIDHTTRPIILYAIMTISGLRGSPIISQLTYFASSPHASLDTVIESQLAGI
ncbi:hypothetical protein DFA_09592 [Cavenderia fasciculata]|uniref:ComC supersandwich domain-containing protein n=1 Tax=Cavenderia fasciculata TaxID=261658 RepID=F4Q821_CACFS|nr:uncharacterized protein DFA_09592 [Cavenderia fasciculata]EGG15921.1 hypothetical protein DFA_09592 [Cavenderia fasciculata]|eukprot:XP_004352246.1 hypothetical protein DFA_09592 [Cavenderia fasciculata]